MFNLGHLDSDEETHSLDGAEKDALLDDGTPKLRRTSTSISPRLLLFAFISQFLVILILLIACFGLFAWGQSAWRVAEEAQNNYSILDTFGASEGYMTLDHAFDHLWSETDNSPLVKLDHSSDKVESISMFHQLHCLASIRHALQQAKEGQDIGMDFHDNAHWPHCLDYLRQTILCFADDTMEQQVLFPNGTRSKFIDGLKDVRKCRPREQLYDLRAKNGVFVPEK